MAVASALPPSDEAHLRESVRGVRTSVSIGFLENARRAADAVGRLITRNGRGAGTCFMISPELLATAGHALREDVVSRRRAEFNYEREGSRVREVTRFSLAPERFFVSDARLGLDCAIVALGRRLDGPPFTPAFCPLTRDGSEHVLGYFANLIHHPGDLPKEVVLRENVLLGRDENLVVYATQTYPGSSGAPVFNDEWNVVAMHHWGRTSGELDVNQGIRTAAIARALMRIREALPAKQRVLLDAALPSKR